MSQRDKRAHRAERRPYEPPKILETAEFETLALACTKVDTGTGGAFDCGYLDPGTS